ncbi:MAG: hypothetical protein M3M99_01785 [Actinomycetota bacterium]|nr:hypothetical protein [Actinomycetota bacterium]
MVGLHGGLNNTLSSNATRTLFAMPRIWSVTLAILVVCLIASMVIAIARLT